MQLEVFVFSSAQRVYLKHVFGKFKNEEKFIFKFLK
jgi:hypothetical protein